jgi:hypothetical protein
MYARHSPAALDLALRMDVEEAAKVLTHHQQAAWPGEMRAPLGVEPLRLEAARIVCEWVDLYGPYPTIH